MKQFVVLFALLLPSAQAAAEAALPAVIYGPQARAAAERALLPYIEQYRSLPSVHFSAEFDRDSSQAIGGRVSKLVLSGRYRFWSKGDQYRIDWRVYQSNFQPLERQVWAFDGQRYQSIICGGPSAGLVITRRRRVGFFGPSQSNPILVPIFDLLQRVTKRQPGNWLSYRRVASRPRQVDHLPKNIVVKAFQNTADGAFFTYYPKSMRYPHAWPWKPPAPPWFHPGGRCINCLVLRKRGEIMLPTHEYAPPPGRLRLHPDEGVRFRYKKFLVHSKGVYLPVGEDDFRHGRWQVKMRMQHIVIGGRIDPAVFTIDYNIAQYFIEWNRTVPISTKPLLPPQVRHLGPP